MRGRYRDFSILSCPHTCVASTVINITHQNGAFFFFFSNQGRTYIAMSSKTIIYHRVRSWCCTFCGFRQMYNDIHRYNTMQTVFHCPKNSLCSTCSSPPTPSLATTNLFIFSIIFPFLECHLAGIIEYVALSD